MTIAEELIAKGVAKGRAEGRTEGLLEGRADQLSKLLKLKFGQVALDYQARLAAASVDDLDLWAERVLSAATIDEVFATTNC